MSVRGEVESYVSERPERAGGGPPPQRPAAAEAPDARELLHILSVRRAWIVAATAVCLVLAAAYLLFTAPLYTAASQLVVDPRERRVIENGVAPNQTTAENGLAIAESQLRIITSEAVMRRVVLGLGLDRDPEFGGQPTSGPRVALRGLAERIGLGHLVGERGDPVTRALQRLERRVTARRADRAFVIDVLVSSESPAKAVRIADALAEAYLTDQASSRAQSSRDASLALSSRLDELRDAVRRAEDRVEAFKRENNIIGASGRLVSEQQLTEMNNQLTVARARTAEAAARLDQIQRLRRGTVEASGIPEAIQSATITALRSQLADIARQQSDNANRLGPRHPTTLALETQLQGVRRLIQEELGRITEAARADLERAQANERSLERSLESLKRDAVTLGQSSVQLRELEREVEASRAVYNAFLVRARETGEQQGLDTTNARIISRALLPRDASWPPNLLILTAALLGGLGLGGGLALMREAAGETIRSRRQLRSLTGGAVVAVPLLSAAGRRSAFGFGRRTTVDGVEGRLFHLSAEPGSAFARGVRGALNAVVRAPSRGDCRVVLVTSAEGGAGVSTTAVNLGLAALQDHESVLVIDADPSGPSIGEQLGLSHPVDFSDVLSGQAELSAAVLDHPWSHLHLLPSEPGRKPWLRHVGLVGEWRRLLERAQDYDLVIVDAGPILGAPVALMLAPMVDDIVLVARQASTPRHAFDECLAALGGHADKLRATVLTGDAGEG